MGHLVVIKSIISFASLHDCHGIHLALVQGMDNKLFLWLSAITFSAASATAQNRATAVVPAQRLTVAIEIDGKLKEKAWKSAKRLSAFVQREPDAGKAVSEKTEVAMFYDESHLYLGVWCYDRQHEHLTAQKMQRDFDFSTEDNFIVVIDTYNDERNGYLFVVNPNGAMADALVTDNGKRVNKDWDGVWQAAAIVHKLGWFAEIAIPFSTLKFDAAREIWGVNFERNIRRKREQAVWQGWSQDANIEQVSRAGNLTNLKGLRRSNALVLRPYSLGGFDQTRGLARNAIADAGGDLDYLITPALKLNVTLNPDFAQVESDRAQVNLTRFSLKFPEKRKFFLEGRDVFDFGLGDNMQPFYSRRIGLAGNGSEVPVLGGVRMLGKSGRATLGGMVLQSARRDTIPSTNYAALRWRQDVLAQSSFGLIATTKSAPGNFNATYGGDYLFSTSNLFGGKNFLAGAAYAMSHTSHAEQKSGNAQRAFVSYPNDFIEFEASWERAGAAFNPEVGFLRRKSYRLLATELEINPRWRARRLSWLRQLEFKPVELDYYRDDETGALQSLALEFRPFGFSTKSRERFKFNVQRFAENLNEEFEIVNALTVSPGRYWFTRYEAELSTFTGRSVSGALTVNWGDFYNGRRTEWAGNLVWRMNRFWSFGFDYQTNLIALPGGNFRLHEAGTRADFALNPRLFGALFAQWNNEDEAALLNFRVQWIPKPGADFFFVVNQNLDAAGNKWQGTNTTMLTKLVWHFAFTGSSTSQAPAPKTRVAAKRGGASPGHE